MEYLSAYQRNEGEDVPFPVEEEKDEVSLITEPDPLAGCDTRFLTCVNEVRAMYPGFTTLGEIMRVAIGANDRVSVRKLALYRGYLPIQWDDLISISSNTMIPLFEHKLSNEGRLRAAYKRKDHSVISRYPPNIPLAIEYGYEPYLSRNNPATLFASDDDRILLSVTDENTQQMIAYAIEYSRPVVIERMLRNFEGRSIIEYITPQDLLEPFLNRILPQEIMRSFFANGYYTEATIDNIPTRIVRAITFNDPSLLPPTYTPTMRELALIFEFDASRIFKSEMVGRLNPAWNIHGNILRTLLLERTGRRDLRILLRNAKSEDIDAALNVTTENSKRMVLLTEALNMGYIEVLDKHVDDMQTIFLLLASIRQDSEYYEELINFFNWKSEHTGTYLQAMYTDIMDINIPESFWRSLLASAIAIGNVPLVSAIAGKYTIDDAMRTRAVAMAQQYHIDDPSILEGIMRVL